MKLVTFTHAGATRLGSVVGEEVVDLAAAAPELLDAEEEKPILPRPEKPEDS